MTHYDAIEVLAPPGQPPTVGGDEIRQRLAEALGGTVRCHTFYDWDFAPGSWNNVPHPVYGDTPSPDEIEPMRRKIDVIARMKGVGPNDLVMLDCESTPVRWDWVAEATRARWKEYLRRASPWTSFQSRFVLGYNERTFNAACIDMYRAMVDCFAPNQTCFYNVFPGMKDGSKQHDRWASLVGRHTAPVYPDRPGGVYEAWVRSQPSIGSWLLGWSKSTIIQSPFYVHHNSAQRGQPLQPPDIIETVTLARLHNMDTIWWLPIKTQAECDLLRGSWFFDVLAEAVRGKIT